MQYTMYFHQFCNRKLGALLRQISVIANLRVPPLESEVGDRYGKANTESSMPFDRALQSQILQISEIGECDMHYDIKKSGERIQELRKKSNMKQAQLAEILNISLNHVKKIEGGQRGCSVDLLISLSTLFETSIDFLVLGKGGSNTAIQKGLQCIIDEATALKNNL